MNTEEVKAYIDEHLEMLPSNKVLSQVEAQRRASKFLAVVAVLASYKHELMSEKIEKQSLFSVANSEAIQHVAAQFVDKKSSADERSALAEASEEYMQAREAVEQLDNDIRYIHTIIEVMNNAHILLRSMAKEIM